MSNEPSEPPEQIDPNDPTDLYGDILGPGGPAKSITGKWRLTGEDLELTEIVRDGQEVEVAPAALKCFNTGVIRVETGGEDGRQYVFSKP